MIEYWQTAFIGEDTPRGRRYRGVCFVSEGREWRVREDVNGDAQRLPRRARITYRTRAFTRDKRWTHAWETARSRTIHHNLYHADNPANGHVLRWCHEREA